MTEAKNGDNVTIHYTGRRADGSIFFTSEGSEPISFTLGEGELIDGFEDAVRGMAVGEKKTVVIPPEKAYGERLAEMVIEVPLAELPADITPKVGQELELTSEDDDQMVVMITGVTEEHITIDGNPPLAGETLTFDLQLVQLD